MKLFEKAVELGEKVVEAGKEYTEKTAKKIKKVVI